MPSGFIVKFSLGFRSAIISKFSSSSLLNPYDFSLRRSLCGYSTAAIGSKPVIGDIHIDEIASNELSPNRSRPNSLKMRVRMINVELPGAHLACGFLRKIRTLSSFVSQPLLKSFTTLSALQFSAVAARDMSFDGNEEPVKSTLVSSQTLKLLSGSCYLPHPEKEATGGEDAHFICEDQQAIGVADGVGGWADVGINAGDYARELMSNSICAIQDEPKGSIDPFRVLEKAHSSTKAKGSSTACIIALTYEGINAINLGDSRFMVVRGGSTVCQSLVQQHSFNLTYQLESGGSGDLPSSGQVFRFPVSSGDVIIAGTDGLFDNLYNNEVTAIVVQASRAGFGPQLTAEKIAALARRRALHKNRQTPFASAAQEAGFRYHGGKLDDITVVVSYIRSLNTE